MKDPLAGRRQDINEGRANGLEWPDSGEGCPVEVGQTFPLRSCWINITSTQRIRRGSEWKWLALFARYTPDKVHLLGRSGGYTEDEKQAMKAQDDPDTAGTLASLKPLENPLNLGAPPEPEAVPPEEIPNLIGSLEAQQRYEFDLAERRVAEASAPLEQRLSRLREMSRLRGVDITSDLFVIEQRLEKAERKVLERAAA